jgi:hypothetical protein
MNSTPACELLAHALLTRFSPACQIYYAMQWPAPSGGPRALTAPLQPLTFRNGQGLVMAEGARGLLHRTAL